MKRSRTVVSAAAPLTVIVPGATSSTVRKRPGIGATSWRAGVAGSSVRMSPMKNARRMTFANATMRLARLAIGARPGTARSAATSVR